MPTLNSCRARHRNPVPPSPDNSERGATAPTTVVAPSDRMHLRHRRAPEPWRGIRTGCAVSGRLLARKRNMRSRGSRCSAHGSAIMLGVTAGESPGPQTGQRTGGLMDLVIPVAAGAIASLIVCLAALARWRPTPAGGRPSGAAIGFRIEPSQGHADPLGTPARSVSFPVTSLAGLPVRRPATEGHRLKRSNRLEQRSFVRRALAATCASCQESRREGRNYCRDCDRRLSPFLQ